jgi:quinolinate synthase
MATPAPRQEAFLPEERLARALPSIEWPVHLPAIRRIQELKRARGALVLAHNYQAPEIFHGIADVTGDSLALAQEATRSELPVVVVCGVHFMAETVKILNPDKIVLLPDLEAGCSLASSITAEQVRQLCRAHPGLPVVSYVNTPAAVKAESDICCTSANAVEIVSSLGAPRVLFVPDGYLGRYVAARTGVELISWDGRCEVHERFRAEDLRAIREAWPGIEILAHPECAPEVIGEADHTGSTSDMIRYIRSRRPARVALITECSMADNLAVEFPEIEFVRPCSLCPHMRRIRLEKVERALERLEPRIEVPEEIARRARRAVERMLEFGRRA